MELIFLFILTIFLCKICIKRGGVISKTVFIIILLILAFVAGGQLSSLIVTGHYVDVLTLSNIYSYRDVGWKIILSSSFIILFCLGLICFAAATSSRGWYRWIRLPAALYCLFFMCVNPQGAILNFGKTYQTYLNQSFFAPNAQTRRLQQKLYAQENTFDNDFDAQKIMDFRNKNIVVVFAEGFSLQFIGKFNQYKDLTPNIDEFLEKSVYFDNYYNHTAATFRGLRGQLTSSYQLRTGYVKAHNGLGQISEDKIKKTLTGQLISVPHILKNNGYHSYFLSTHPSGHQLNMMLKTLEFDAVYGSDYFISEKNKNLTDQQLFSDLGDLINNNKLQQPFFIGTYNIGTHLGQDSPDLKYGDGKNILLNTVHNFDSAFGKFWNSVKDRKDLVVILTADHAAYPYGGLYDRTFLTKRTYPVDKIPFALWQHDIKPRVFDAKGRVSLDFAPTLMQAMGIRHEFNYFLGCSLFNLTCTKQFEHIADRAGNVYLETPSLRRLDSNNEDDRKIIQKIKDFYNLSEDRRFM